MTLPRPRPTKGTRRRKPDPDGAGFCVQRLPPAGFDPDALPPDPSRPRIGFDLAVGDMAQNAVMIRKALESGAIRLFEIPEQASRLAHDLVTAIAETAKEGQWYTHAQLLKTMLAMMDYNLRVVAELDRQAKKAPEEARKGEADPELAARIERLVAREKAAVRSADGAPAPQLAAAAESTPLDQIIARERAMSPPTPKETPCEGPQG